MDPGRLATIIFLFIPYQASMMYGMFMLASFWASRDLRGLPDYIFFVFVLGIPLVGWLLSTFAPFFGFVLPASLGFVYWYANRHDAAIVAGARLVIEDERAGALAALAADEKNAAAHWTLAQGYEAEKNYDLALEHYERAHRIDQRTVTPQEMTDHRDRLASMKELERENPFREEEARADAKRARFEKFFLLVAGACLLAGAFAWAANLASMVLFVQWFRPLKRNC